jgi:addiction module HigA family antidote
VEQIVALVGGPGGGQDGLGGPIHPGEILAEEFLRPLAISQYRLSKEIGVPPRRVNGKRGISADTALRLARYFGTSPEFWMNLRSHYDLEMRRDAVGSRIEHDVKVLDREVA